MASPTSSDRGKCKHTAAEKVCRCQEWDPSHADESLCECCMHHMSFHEPRHLNVGHGRCVKELDDDKGSPYEDGCQEFCPHALNSKKCAGCGCHRSLHVKVVVLASEQLASPSNVPIQQEESSIQPNTKKDKLDLPIISTNVGEDEEAIGAGARVDMECENDMPDECVDPGLQHGRCVEDDNARIRNHLQPKHKVFLSHSGFQKSFVDQLCIDLERTDRYPFFDKRPDSVPIGRKFPELLFSAIQQCEVGVVVFSEEFFTHSKWPMLELVEMVRASEELQSGINIVPIFYNISREKCRDKETQRGWISKWEEWAKIDSSINIDKWMKALKIFGSTSGLALRNPREEVQLRFEVVEAVCKSVLPESRPDDSYVEGKVRLCKIILDKIESNRQDSSIGVRIVGLYGIGGIGKTTICKVLFNKFFKELRGKVCHVELKSKSKLELCQELLKTVTNTRHDLLDKMDIDECEDQLKRCIVKQRIFLAIDNVDEESANEAKIYLEATHSFANGSVVVVTSRSLGQLKALNIPEDDCIGMPELQRLEARNLFKRCVASILGAEIKVDDKMIDACVEVCCLKVGDGINHHYHPLGLKVLGNVLREEMGCDGFDSKQWDAKVSKLEKSRELLEAKKQILSILRISYDTLNLEDQMLFMDVALFVGPKPHFPHDSSDMRMGPNLFEKLGTIHGQLNLDATKAQLEYLKKKSLLESVGDGSTNVGIHDLWREFCIAEIEVEDFADRRCVYYGQDCKGLGESSPSGRCWEKLERMCFTSEAGMEKFFGLQLDHFANLKVLKVVVCMEIMNPVEVDLGKLPHLKHLELGDIRKTFTVRGLRSLSNLAYLKWISMPDDEVYAEDIGFLTNLQFLKLPFSEGQRLPDMSKLTSLRVAFFERCMRVKGITGLSSKLTNLRSLNLSWCWNLRSCPDLDDLISLESLDLTYCGALEELPNLERLTNLKELIMPECSSLSICPGLSGLRYLQKMDISQCMRLRTLPSLSDLVSLVDLNLEGCMSLTSLTCSKPLCNLTRLNLRNCQSLASLDLSCFPNLEMLDVEGCMRLTSLTCNKSLCNLARLILRNCQSLASLDLSCFPNLVWLDFGKSESFTSLSSNVPLHNLKELDLGECQRLTRIPDLSTFINLEYLNLEGCVSLTSLTSKDPLCSLKHLHLRNCRSLAALDLSNFPYLESLDLSNAKNLTSLTSDVPLHDLEEIDLGGCERLPALPDLSDFLNLRVLNLEGCVDLAYLTSTESLVSLKRLSLSRCKSLGTLELSPFPEVEKLELGDCSSLTRLSCAVPLLALEELDLGGCERLEALPDLCSLVNLETLNLSRCSSLACLTSTETLHNLKRLNLWRCGSLGTLDLSPFIQLDWLLLGGCSSLTSLSCTVPLHALKKLDLGGCERLEALPDLCHFVILETLNLLGCSGVACLTSTDTLLSLKCMKLSRCASLGTLDLSPFPQVEKLELGGCSSLTRLSSTVPLLALQELHLAGCKLLKALPDLCNFISMKTLNLSGCSSLTFLTSTETLHNMKRLEVSGCGSLGMLDLSPFPQLEKLELGEWSSLTSLSCTVPMLALKELDLGGFEQLKALPDLCKFVRLETLNLSGCSSLACLTSTENLLSLKRMILWRCGGLGMLDLSAFPQLQNLELGMCSRLTRLSSTVSMLALQELHLGGCELLKALPDLCTFVSLKTLNLSGCSSLTFLTSTVTLHNLKRLKLSRCGSLGMLDLSPFPQLEWLLLGGCSSLTRLSSAIPLRGLKKLDLGGCERLEALPDLSHFVNLKVLNLLACSSLSCLTSTETLHSLKRLDLSRCGSLGSLDLSPFRQVEKLEFDEWSSLTSLSCAVPLLALQELHLGGCELLRALPDLCNFVNLETLNLSRCRSLASLICTETLLSLKRLMLSRCRSLVTLDLSCFPQLERLELGECSSLTSLSCRVPLRALKELDLVGCELLKTLPDTIRPDGMRECDPLDQH